MDINPTAGVAETAYLASSTNQKANFKDRDLKKADSVAKHEEIFFSPVIKIDHETSEVIIQYRDANTGEITNEYPTPKKIESYQKSQAVASPSVAKQDDVAVTDNSKDSTPRVDQGA